MEFRPSIPLKTMTWSGISQYVAELAKKLGVKDETNISPVTRKQSPKMEYHLLRPIRRGPRVLVRRAILFEPRRAGDKPMDALPDWRAHL